MARTKPKSRLGLRLVKGRVIAGVSLVVILVGGVLGYAAFKDTPPAATTSSSGSQENTSVNLGPPSEAEKRETEAYKRSLADEPTNTPPSSATGKNQVAPIITSGDSSYLRAYINGIVEDGGTCSATFTKGSETVTRTAAGFVDVSKTVCVVSTNLSAGNWSVILSYSSSQSEGKSQPYSLEIQ